MSENNRIINRVSAVGVFGNLLLTTFKLAAGILGQSAAMVSDAVHSLSDVIATFIAWIGIRISRASRTAFCAGRRKPACGRSLTRRTGCSADQRSTETESPPIRSSTGTLPFPLPFFAGLGSIRKSASPKVQGFP